MLALVVAACGAGCRKKEGAAAAGKLPDPETSAKALEKLCACPAKVVWLEGAKLMAFDSFQPRAPLVLREAAGLDRPLVSPDGTAVLFTEGGQVHSLTFAAREDRVLTAGHLLDVRHDPETNDDWVYAAPSAKGESIFRFKLTDPAQREAVWDKAPVLPASVQFSRDGARFTGVFHGDQTGLADVAQGGYLRLATGRPAAMASDRSHFALMLDGTGARVRVFHPAGDPWSHRKVDPDLEEATWRAYWTIDETDPVRRLTDLRWTTHAQCVAFAANAPDPARADNRATVLVAKLARDLRSFASTVVIAAAGPQATQPHAWFASGQGSTLEEQPQDAPLWWPEREADGITFVWPSEMKDLQFVWASAITPALPLPGRDAPCAVLPKGWGRFTPWGEMLLDGGTFEADPTSVRAFVTAAAAKDEFSLMFTLAEDMDVQKPVSTRLIALEFDGKQDAFSLSRVDHGLVFRVLLDKGDGSPPQEYQTSLGPILQQGFQASNLALYYHAGKVDWVMDGQILAGGAELGPGTLAAWKPERVQRLAFGDPLLPADSTWEGELSHVTLSAGPLADHRIDARNASLDRSSHSVPRTTRFVGKLVETAPVLSLDPRRQLVQNIYEVEKMLAEELVYTHVSVFHWAVLDGQPVPSLPTKIGQLYTVAAVPVDRRRELDSEVVSLTATGFKWPTFFDVSRPTAPPAPPAESTPSSPDAPSR